MSYLTQQYEQGRRIKDSYRIYYKGKKTLKLKLQKLNLRFSLQGENITITIREDDKFKSLVDACINWLDKARRDFKKKYPYFKNPFRYLIDKGDHPYSSMVQQNEKIKEGLLGRSVGKVT